ncbi:hypothetical protein LVJ83_07100 [Uruburuella testudinis]|uniref:DUF7674 domain-containing protein n=1 Tax=Uruburuella testudinis TaxID=1282863 RepID=A0ABY4DT12_9NEIS|nr:hypothetical protein [Uruburuella testudinis]UOO80757.1 hypothetical protein LVJ83_07100 [Uruburuella testudinis]
MNHDQFLKKIKTISQISLAINNFIDEWGDDLPVMLFGEIGRTIAINLSELSKNDRIYIFAYIKDGMSNGEEVLKNYIATGLLESMYNYSKENNSWPLIKNNLDHISLKYINDWINFENI